MTMPDLSKLQYFSGANSFKNDSFKYSGSVTFPTSLAGGAFATTTQSFTLSATPQFSMLYANYQEYLDALQQHFVGSGYNTAQWYQANVDTKLGLVIPSGIHAGVIDATIYAVIYGTTVTVTGLVNNPYSTAIVLTALTVPWSFIEYTMTN